MPNSHEIPFTAARESRLRLNENEPELSKTDEEPPQPALGYVPAHSGTVGVVLCPSVFTRSASWRAVGVGDCTDPTSYPPQDLTSNYCLMCRPRQPPHSARRRACSCSTCKRSRTIPLGARRRFAAAAGKLLALDFLLLGHDGFNFMDYQRSLLTGQTKI